MPGVRFAVHVVPRSAHSGPYGRHGGLPRLRVRATPTDGAANDEATDVLAKVLGCRVELVRGARSRIKTFETDLESKDLHERLRQIFGA